MLLPNDPSVPEAVESASSTATVVLPEHLYLFSGIGEYEFCPVFVARQASAAQPNPIEVGACAWIEWDEFARRAQEDTGDVYSWWCKNQLRELLGHPLIERYARPATATEP